MTKNKRAARRHSSTGDVELVRIEEKALIPAELRAIIESDRELGERMFLAIEDYHARRCCESRRKASQ